VPDALVITVRFHDGRYHGAGDWPPAPGRLFQALVAGVAVGRSIAPPDRDALAWLEQQDPPVILAPAARQGRGFSTYVPNNDLDAVPGIETVAGNPAGYIKRKDRWEIAASGIRAAKSVRPWLFDAAQPLVYLWPAVTDEPEREGIAALADRLYRLGRGIDPAWAEGRLLPAAQSDELIAAHEGPVWRPAGAGPDGFAVPGRGTLSSLEARHAAFLKRFRQVGIGRRVQTAFANPPKPRFRQIRYEAPPQRLLFDLRAPDGRFLVLPAAEAAPLVRRLVDRAAARLAAALPADAAKIERFLVGRGAGPADLPRRIPRLRGADLTPACRPLDPPRRRRDPGRLSIARGRPRLVLRWHLAAGPRARPGKRRADAGAGRGPRHARPILRRRPAMALRNGAGAPGFPPSARPCGSWQDQARRRAAARRGQRRRRGARRAAPCRPPGTPGGEPGPH
jgi:CRISPR-associated protein Csb2